jgi:hypothetical protein
VSSVVASEAGTRPTRCDLTGAPSCVENRASASLDWCPASFGVIVVSTCQLPDGTVTQSLPLWVIFIVDCSRLDAGGRLPSRDADLSKPVSQVSVTC